jgi:hypothetical protein
MFPNEKLNVLLSFGRRQDKHAFYVTHRDKFNSVVLDSGTYSLNSAERNPPTMTLDKYKNYARFVRRHLDFMFNFDTDFSETGHYKNAINLHNQNYLERAGLDPVPVIHDIYGREISDYIAKNRYPILAIGSSLLGDKVNLSHAIYGIHAAGIKVHLFGTTSYSLLASNPVSSCDSSTWHQNSGRGCIPYWNPLKKKGSKTELIQFEKYDYYLPRISFENYEFRYELKRYLDETFGFSPSDLIGGGQYEINREIVNIHYFVKLQERINQRHQNSGFFARAEDTLM